MSVNFVFPVWSAGAAQRSALQIPSRIDNQKLPFFPEIIAQAGEGCSNASGIGYVFTYEINAARNLPALNDTTTYPYFTTYNFLNDGSEENGTHTMFIDAWEFARDNGIMNADDFGSIEPRSTKWASGYEHYLNGMKNRVAGIDSLSFHDNDAFTYFKRLLYDHGDGSLHGGIFLVTVCAYGVQDAKIESGPEKGKYIVHSLGTRTDLGGHTLTVTGYNDSITYDYNYNGAITTDVDINSDGVVDIGDSEKGAFICANTWGTSSGDSGFIYVPYRLFVTPLKNGGSLTNRGYFITVRKDHHPDRTLKAGLTHTRRNSLSLSVGVTADSAAAEPSHVRLVNQFNYAGGALPLCGYNASSSIEIGLDVSDLADSLGGKTASAYFLIIDAKDSIGRCTALSLINHAAADTCENDMYDFPCKIVKGKNIFRIAVPVTRISRSGNRTAQPALPSIRSTADGIVLQLTCGKNRVSIIRTDGSLFHSQTIEGTGCRRTLPVRTGPGLFIVRITDHHGLVTQEQRIITLH